MFSQLTIFFLTHMINSCSNDAKLLCAAGEESLKIVIEEDMAGKAARIEQHIHSALHSMAEEFELIGDIRGRGVLVGIELVTDREKKIPANAEVGRIAEYCLDRGLIFQLRGTQGDLNVIRLVPPMTTRQRKWIAPCRSCEMPLWPSCTEPTSCYDKLWDPRAWLGTTAYDS